MGERSQASNGVVTAESNHSEFPNDRSTHHIGVCTFLLF